MAQAQLSHSADKFQRIDISVSDNILIGIHSDYLSIKQRHPTGKSKTCIISRANWFQLIQFADLIQKCFLMKHDLISEDIDKIVTSKTIKKSHTKK